MADSKRIDVWQSCLVGSKEKGVVSDMSRAGFDGK
jgi:hypothetical protein